MLNYGQLIELSKKYFDADNHDDAERRLASLFYVLLTDDQIDRATRVLETENANPKSN